MLSFKISFNYEEKTLHIECEKLHIMSMTKEILLLFYLKKILYQFIYMKFSSLNQKHSLLMK